ncbi:sacsin N-terminal ATP-binding-like domain-containing protein [Desulfolutivibrio sulfoxidireducens]|uniref:sacsin N-terminal ATP-binding-like domain-containing protein n=1 Tax=Desulfolutivibrio sulfoxidireducens TaxID=2773299 RepID=UPI00159D8C48|nr:DUF3883 domain-containing protein [Desulfolutivibrio sulfoxidireducens]QLA20894.1 DUF3883 domain-containing protein [Desulfolutivibrio sulfoxidireducens]
MPRDYAAIRAENERRYGTDIGRIGQMLLADRYDDRTHFIFELLQNAEDALARRRGWSGSRAVRFTLQSDVLHFSHYGKLFDDPDVRGICGIAESTKDKTAIGRFGIGFKSVYAYSTRPEVHSGDEAFAIDSFVWPTPTQPLPHQPDETIIALPLNAGVKAAREEIAGGLQRLGPTALLFLREIEEIEWSVADGSSGMYMRSKPEAVSPGVRKISLIGQQADAKEIEESWLIFYRDVAADDGTVVGQVEVAFSIIDGANSDKWSITRVSNSPLVVYFPTVVPTHLGFLIQGPYRTTPSRDNIAKNDPWNQHLIQETCSMLVESLHALRDMHLLNTDALRVLPLDRARFSHGQMFAPVFEAVRTALRSERLLPSADNGHVAASRAKLARTKELRALFTPQQLTDVLGEKEEVAWLSGDITQDRTPDLRQYLMQELSVSELTPETILPRLTKPFMEEQCDDWIVQLYEFLKERPALHRRVEEVPLIRLSDGTHLKAKDGSGKPQAFLPSVIETGFPTVKASVCKAGAATEFLLSLGLREPDPVDDVIFNVLPKYKHDSVRVDDQVYAVDFQRITNAFKSDSTSQRSRLTDVLRQSYVVKAVDGGDGAKIMAKPGAVYVATERLRELFNGVTGVLLVDDSYECLRGEAVRDLLVACGTSRYLRPFAVQTNFTWQERAEMRRAAGCEDCTYDIELKDSTLSGIENVLSIISTADQPIVTNKARLLWEALADVMDRSGIGAFSGTYSWMYFHPRTYRFDAAFVRLLNETAWVPTADGSLHLPGEVIFDTLGWKPDPLLQSKILFKPPIIEQLAKEAGIDPGVLDLLKRLGVTSEEELRHRLGVNASAEDKPEAEDEPTDDNPPEDDEGIEEPNDDGAIDGSTRDHDFGGQGSSEPRKQKHGRSEGGSSGEGHNRGSQGGSEPGHKGGGGQTEPTGICPFISYIGTHPFDDEDEHDPDGLTRDARMALEAKAIEFILKFEPELERTQANNPGFDLFEPGDHGRPIRWVEVKAMTGSLDDRPVCMSRTQFDCAWVNGEAFWLYIVEHASDPTKARILRVNDPAGKARNFTFDRGWSLVAEDSKGGCE